MEAITERVARALAAYTNGGPPRWETLNASARSRYMNLARAAIEAMREPTSEMVDILGDAMGDRPTDHERAPDVWRSLIDEALNPTQA